MRSFPNIVDLRGCAGDICEEPLPEPHPYRGLFVRPASDPYPMIVGQSTIFRGIVDYAQPDPAAFRRAFVPTGFGQGGSLHLVAEAPGEYELPVTNIEGRTFPLALIVVPDEGNEVAAYNASRLRLRGLDFFDPLTWALLAPTLREIIAGAIDESYCGHDAREGLRALRETIDACERYPHLPTLSDVIDASGSTLLLPRIARLCRSENGSVTFHDTRRCVNTWKSTRQAAAVFADVIQIATGIVAGVVEIVEAIAGGGSSKVGSYINQAGSWIASALRPDVLQAALGNPGNLVSDAARALCSHTGYDAFPQRLAPVVHRRRRHAELVAPLAKLSRDDIRRCCADGSLFVSVSVAAAARTQIEQGEAQRTRSLVQTPLVDTRHLGPLPGPLGASTLPSASNLVVAKTLAPTLAPTTATKAPSSTPTTRTVATATKLSDDAPSSRSRAPAPAGTRVPLFAIVENLAQGLEFELPFGAPQGKKLPPPISSEESAFWEEAALAYARGQPVFEGTLFRPGPPVAVPPVDVPPVAVRYMPPVYVPPVDVPPVDVPYEDAFKSDEEEPIGPLMKQPGGKKKGKKSDDSAVPALLVAGGAVAAVALLLGLRR